jgi:hypothetical protein
MGPNGKYIAASSPVFDGNTTLDDDGTLRTNAYAIYFPTNDKKTREDEKIEKEAKERNKIALQLLENFIDKLLKDGWDDAGDYADNTYFRYHKQFRRRAK